MRYTYPIVMIICSLIIACAQTGADQESFTDNPWSGSNVGKADIYGDDSRHELNDPEISDKTRELSRSVAMILNVSSIFDISDTEIVLNSTTLNDKVQSETGAPLCEEEAFSQQPAPGYCTGFLIAPDLIATAGHCVNKHTRCEKMAFIFDYAKKLPNEEIRRVPRDQFYRCESLIARVYNPFEEYAEILSGELWYDWAVMRLDRPVTDRAPVTLMSGDRLLRGAKVQAIGHPMGIAMKVTNGDVITDDKDRFMNTNLDIYQGNSGSPVFNPVDGHVHGIVTRGSGGNSFEVTRAGCTRSKHCDQVGDPGCIGNHVSRIDPLYLFADHPFDIVERHSLVEDDGSPISRYSFTFDEEKTVSFVTLHLNGGALESKKLKILLHHQGDRVTMMNHPVKLPYGRWTATTDLFKGHLSQGEWIIEIIDEGGGNPYIEWAQVMIGVEGSSN